MHLQNVASKLPIEILLGKKAIEIRPQNVNKGATVRKIMASYPDADFIFCVGDDKTDEDMFLALHPKPGMYPFFFFFFLFLFSFFSLLLFC